MEYCTPLVITYFAINWCFCVNFVFHQKSDEPIPLENQPHTAPKEEKSAVKFETKSAIWVFAILLILPLSYYFSLDRFERVQQGEKEMVELANKKADTSMVHQKKIWCSKFKIKFEKM